MSAPPSLPGYTLTTQTSTNSGVPLTVWTRDDQVGKTEDLQEVLDVLIKRMPNPNLHATPATIPSEVVVSPPFVRMSAKSENQLKAHGLTETGVEKNLMGIIEMINLVRSYKQSEQMNAKLKAKEKESREIVQDAVDDIAKRYNIPLDSNRVLYFAREAIEYAGRGMMDVNIPSDQLAGDLVKHTKKSTIKAYEAYMGPGDRHVHRYELACYAAVFNAVVRVVYNPEEEEIGSANTLYGSATVTITDPDGSITERTIESKDFTVYYNITTDVMANKFLIAASSCDPRPIPESVLSRFKTVEYSSDRNNESTASKEENMIEMFEDIKPEELGAGGKEEEDAVFKDKLVNGVPFPVCTPSDGKEEEESMLIQLITPGQLTYSTLVLDSDGKKKEESRPALIMKEIQRIKDTADPKTKKELDWLEARHPIDTGRIPEDCTHGISIEEEAKVILRTQRRMVRIQIYNYDQKYGEGVTHLPDGTVLIGQEVIEDNKMGVCIPVKIDPNSFAQEIIDMKKRMYGDNFNYKMKKALIIKNLFVESAAAVHEARMVMKK